VPDVVAVRDYVSLCLELDHLIPGAVTVRSGDLSAWQPRGSSAAALVREAGRLAMRLPDAGLEPVRERFLAAQLAAVECTARRLAGQAVPFDAEVAACFDVAVPAPVDTGPVRRELDALLPGRGDLAERLTAHRERDAVPRDRLPAAVAALAAELRERCARAGLLAAAEEEVEFVVVDDAPWNALHRRLAPGRSQVLVNAGARLRRSRLAQLVAHEAYPGHHAEQLHRETVLVGERGLREHEVVLLRSPQSVLAEGAAECGLRVLLGREWGPVVAGVLGEVGVPVDGGRAQGVEDALARLAEARVEAAVLLHARRARPVEVLAHLRRTLLLDDAGARRVLRFVADPRWRGSPVAAVAGARLVGRWLDAPGATAAERWRALHDGTWTPSGLRGELDRTAHGPRQAVFVKR
jgi:hypothetical protein